LGTQRHSYEVGGGQYLESHHLGWQAAAFAIEEADGVGRCLLGLSIEVDRDMNMVYDMQLGHILPNDAALRSAGLDIFQIRRQLVWLRACQVGNTNEIENAKSFKGNSCSLNYRGRYQGKPIESCWSTVRVRYPSEFHPDMPF
jgi:hypothetical protein